MYASGYHQQAPQDTLHAMPRLQPLLVLLHLPRQCYKNIEHLFYQRILKNTQGHSIGLRFTRSLRNISAGSCHLERLRKIITQAPEYTT